MRRSSGVQVGGLLRLANLGVVPACVAGTYQEFNAGQPPMDPGSKSWDDIIVTGRVRNSTISGSDEDGASASEPERTLPVLDRRAKIWNSAPKARRFVSDYCVQ